METTITIKIENIIQKQCYNFLSYLYANCGWKRIMFETAKENFVCSNVKDKKIRIVITQTSEIFLTCYCFLDVLTAFEYITEQFRYGRMEHYLVVDNPKIKYQISDEYMLLNDYMPDEFKDDLGIIKWNNNSITLIYDDLEKKKPLFDLFRDSFII